MLRLARGFGDYNSRVPSQSSPRSVACFLSTEMLLDRAFGRGPWMMEIMEARMMNVWWLVMKIRFKMVVRCAVCTVW